jgi:hypothetical protein
VVAVREVLQRLADLAADAEDRPAVVVPELGLHALADQLQVLVADVVAAHAAHAAHAAPGAPGAEAMTTATTWLTTLRHTLP